MQTATFPALQVNGKAPTVPVKPRSQRKPTVRPPSRRAALAPVRDQLHRWAHGYVWGAVAVSAALNALAFGAAAPPELRPAAWALGVLIPCGVLALGRVASLLHLRGARVLALTTGAVAAALLLLSVWHCTESVALLTGSPVPLAAALAIGVDAGLVVCEVGATLTGRAGNSR